MNILLWIAQGLLAIAFLMGGSFVLFQPAEAIAGKMSFVNHYSVIMVKFISACEVLGAIGLILPSAFRIKPWLTPLAALGLAVIMLLATNYHFNHGEAGEVPMTIILGLIAVFIAWGRWKKVPIRSRNKSLFIPETQKV